MYRFVSLGVILTDSSSIATYCYVFTRYCNVFAMYCYVFTTYCNVFAMYCYVFATYRYVFAMYCHVSLRIAMYSLRIAMYSPCIVMYRYVVAASARGPKINTCVARAQAGINVRDARTGGALLFSPTPCSCVVLRLQITSSLQQACTE